MVERSSTHSFVRSPLVWIVSVVLVALAVWWFMPSAPTPAKKGPPAGFVPSVPVKVDVARVQDLDIFLRGLGTVTPFNTVTVRSRVQGETSWNGQSEAQCMNSVHDAPCHIQKGNHKVKKQRAQSEQEKQSLQSQSSEQASCDSNQRRL